MYFEIIGDIKAEEKIALVTSFKEIARLRKKYRSKKWRKMKRITKIKLADNSIKNAEIHWYEAHGI